MFAALDRAQRYVVLRNYDGLPNAALVEGHGDVDLLVEDAGAAVAVLGATPVFLRRHRVHMHLDVGGDSVRADLRSVGDGYFDTRWQLDVLGRRVLLAPHVWVPQAEDAFWTLLYHAIVHKPRVAPDYRRRLAETAAAAGVTLPSDWTRDDAIALLRDYLKARDYLATDPDDLSVWFNPGTLPATPTRAIRQLAQLGLVLRQVARSAAFRA